MRPMRLITMSGGDKGHRKGSSVMTLKQFLLSWMLFAMCRSALPAADWPQILGPNRNGIADPQERIQKRWKGPIPTAWSRPVGSGFAGLAVAEGRAILFHRQADEEVIECLDPATGKVYWKDAHPTQFRPQYGSDDGPLCTPTITQGKVITYGAEGYLSCHDLQSGQLLWKRETHTDFQADTGYFGAGSSPLIVGDHVIVNVGGKRRSAGVVSFRLSDGETQWQKIADDASYSAPVMMEVADTPIAIVVTRLKCVGLEIAHGSELFEVPFGARGPTVNGASPVIVDQRIFLSSSYGVGALLGRFDFPTFQTEYAKEDFFSTQYATPIHWQGVFYGIDGRDDTGPADLKCFDPLKKKLLWSEQNFGYGTQILVDGALLFVKTNGELVLVDPVPEGYAELGRDPVFSGTTRALPALSNGLLYVRDDTTLKCLDLRIGDRP